MVSWRRQAGPGRLARRLSGGVRCVSPPNSRDSTASPSFFSISTMETMVDTAMPSADRCTSSCSPSKRCSGQEQGTTATM